MSVVLESADYLMVINRLIDKALERGAEVWVRDGRPERHKLRAFIGTVWQLYYAVKPLVGDVIRDDRGFFRAAMEAKERQGSILEVWERTNEALLQLLAALKHKGLLVRVSTIQVDR